MNITYAKIEKKKYHVADFSNRNQLGPPFKYDGYTAFDANL